VNGSALVSLSPSVAKRGAARPPISHSRFVGVQQIRELGERRVAVGSGEERPGLEVRDRGCFFAIAQVERVHGLDAGRGALLRGRAREHLAQHDRQARIVPLERLQDQLEVARDHIRRRALLEIVRAGEQHHRRRVER
jgi:hypothetical protein